MATSSHRRAGSLALPLVVSSLKTKVGTMSSAEPPPPKPAPGWYLDPSGTGAQRYFDGTTWISQFARHQAHRRRATLERRSWR
ncbi:DUF2510 domain-containing protein [Mycobacterium haemophilum]|uniref:DUF2510 domain-containing protein n=2 Tax=Mycobacterium haemophilum TaxID=29311 RepID=UPI0009E95152